MNAAVAESARVQAMTPEALNDAPSSFTKIFRVLRVLRGEEISSKAFDKANDKVRDKDLLASSP